MGMIEDTMATGGPAPRRRRLPGRWSRQPDKPGEAVSERGMFLFWLAFSAVAIVFAAIPVDMRIEIGVAALLYSTAFVLARIANHKIGLTRTFALFCCAIITTRYLVWRTTTTLGYHDFFSFVGAIILYIAELYGIILFLLSLMTTIMPIDRRRDDLVIDHNDPLLPRVDVLLPTYNEAESLLRVTVAAAVALRYPADKLRVHLLDDGGTVQKRNQADPEKRQEAWDRHHALQKMCAEFGVYYHTRERNIHAKSGNINSVLGSLEGDLVLVLDADHVPTVDFLEHTVQPFMVDPKLFLVQTPHFFINPDPLEKNLRGGAQGPAESAMFYRLIMKGLDYWNATIFCGSAAVLRRSLLLEVGGFAQATITEDAETAMELHSRGYRSAYIDRPMISGLSAESFESFLIQRSRWGIGMLQMLILQRPLTRKGLSFAQRICYLSSTLFWFFPIPRTVFMLAPIAYLLLHLRVYDTNTPQFLVYSVPHIMASGLASHILFGRYRWPLVSTVYETMLALLMVRGVVGTLLSPRTPLFKVTPKGTTFDREFVSPLARPSYIALTLVAVAAVAGFLRLAFGSGEDVGVVLVTMTWNFINLMVLIMAIGAMLEQRQRRSTHRIDINIPVEVEREDGTKLDGFIADVSAQGARVVLKEKIADKPGKVFILMEHEAYHRPARIEATVRSVIRIPGRPDALGLAFDFPNLAAWIEVVTIVHGVSARWDAIWTRDSKPVSVAIVLFRFTKISILQLKAHAGEIVREIGSIILIDSRRFFRLFLRKSST